MSSGVVRTAFRQELQAAFPAVPYVEVIAERVDNEALPPLWQGLEFIPATDRPISLGSPACWREIGSVRVWVVGVAGGGDSAMVAQADAVTNHFRRWGVPAEQLRVMYATPPYSAPESDGRWLRIAVDLSYQRDYYA